MHITLAFRTVFCTPFCRRNACQSVRQPPPHLLVNGEWIFDSESYGPIKFQLRVHPLLTDILCTWPADIYRMYPLFTACCGSTCAYRIFTLRENSHLSEFIRAALHQTSERNDVFFAVIHIRIYVRNILEPLILISATGSLKTSSKLNYYHIMSLDYSLILKSKINLLIFRIIF